MARIEIWTPQKAKKTLQERLMYCYDARKDTEYQWEENERTVYNTRGKSFTPDLSITFESEVELGITDVDQSNTDIGVNYTFKNLRFIQSQLSANPPSVISRPTSNDLEDRRKADAADRLIRFAIRQYGMQEKFDRCSLNTLLYGTGFIKTMWDGDSGEILELDEESGELTMEGDISIEVPNPWDIYLDPDGTEWKDVRYIFQRMTLPWEEAIFRFPESEDILKKYKRSDEYAYHNERGGRSALRQRKFDVVELFQYWEKGLPYNGMIGRFCYCTRDGDVLGEVKPNPFRFKAPKQLGDEEETRSKVPIAKLPFHIFTDVDMPHTPWGRSIVSFEAPLQDTLNRIDNVKMDILQAHGVARMALPEGTEISDDSITNSSWDIIKYTGNQAPHFMEALPMPPSLTEMREQIRVGIDDMAGVNESMFGQQSRETSGFSMQYATNQGNMIRRRLFNKYVLLTESVYKSFLNLVRTKWEEKRIIYVLGTERAFEAMDIKGADIDGGFDLVVEYGASLSLDPTTRREEILTMMPIFEKAGITPSKILELFKLNELEGLFDANELAVIRQQEIFDEMISKNIYIKPKELERHKKMIEYGYDYVMGSTFKYLDEDHQKLIEQHIKEREQLEAPPPAAGAGPGGMPPGPPPEGAAGPLPTPPEMGGGPAEVGQLGQLLGGGG
jgi:hypothetical protein